MAKSLEEVRSAMVAAVGTRATPGTRYPGDLRTAAVRAARRALRAGASRAAVARELDIPVLTLKRWLSDTRAGFVPVEIPLPAPAISSGPVVVTPEGYRVEGLDVDGAAALLRVLSASLHENAGHASVA